MSIFEGSGVALITPFTENGVDFDKLKELLEWHVKEGTDAILICGTTGEAVSMTDKEKKETIKFTVDVINKRIPVIAGSGSNNTTAAIEMSKYCESVGVDALLNNSNSLMYSRSAQNVYSGNDGSVEIYYVNNLRALDFDKATYVVFFVKEVNGKCYYSDVISNTYNELADNDSNNAVSKSIKEYYDALKQYSDLMKKAEGAHNS